MAVCWIWILSKILISLFMQGFDEFMNVVLDDAEEIYVGKNAAGRSNRPLGMLKHSTRQILLLTSLFRSDSSKRR